MWIQILQDAGNHFAGAEVEVGIDRRLPLFLVPFEGIVALVVAGPKGEGGVIAQAGDDGFCFLMNRVEECLVARINGAGHGKVLPYQDARFVT